MQTDIIRTGETFNYDSYRDGHDTTMIDDLSGTSSVSANKLLVSSTDIATFVAVNNQTVEILMSVPVAPVAAQSKVFGLKSPAGGNRGAIVFEITDDVLTVKVYLADGSDVLFSQVIPWDSGWTAADIRYRICVSERTVRFFIEDTCVATFGDKQGEIFDFMPRMSLPVRVTNGNADNLFVSTINIV